MNCRYCHGDTDKISITIVREKYDIYECDHCKYVLVPGFIKVILDAMACQLAPGWSLQHATFEDDEEARDADKTCARTRAEKMARKRI